MVVRSQIDSTLPDAVEQFVQLTKLLQSDVTALLEHAKKDPSDLARRSATRSAFAAIEGLVAATKDMLVEVLPAVRHHYSDAEVAMLREVTYALTDKGDAVTSTRFLRLEDNVRFVWKMIVREWGIEPEIDFASEGWRAFCGSVKVRNRITHPKRSEDMTISDAEFQQVEKGYVFVHAMTMRNLFRALKAARLRDYERMNLSLSSHALRWLDALEQRGPSPLARPLTQAEIRDLRGIEKEHDHSIAGGLRACAIVEEQEGILSLTQKGADYRAWRHENPAHAS